MSRDSNETFVEISTNWAYRRIISVDGRPFVLFEKERLLQAEDKHNNSQVEGSQVIPTGDIKVEPLREALDKDSREKIVEEFNMAETE